ncbi:MAG: sulfotransferase family protein [Planctomycetota bacterium]
MSSAASNPQNGSADRPKVFCIGFMKTGTTSLGAALEVLGYRVAGPFGIHDPRIAEHAWPRAQEVLEHYDAVQDNPWPVLFTELDAAYPGSKFILSTRDLRSWIGSVERYFGPKYRTPMRDWIFGPADNEERREKYLARYERHTRKVRAHFAGRDGDLLEIDLSRDAGWGRLCSFLECPVPDAPFPSLNTSKSNARLSSVIGRKSRRLGRLLGLIPEPRECWPPVPRDADPTIPAPR